MDGLDVPPVMAAPANGIQVGDVERPKSVQVHDCARYLQWFTGVTQRGRQGLVMFALTAPRVDNSTVHQIDNRDNLQRHRFVTAYEGSSADSKAARERNWAALQACARKPRLCVALGSVIVCSNRPHAGTRLVSDNDAMPGVKPQSHVRAAGFLRHPHLLCGV